jgi:enamine deaminase RidA (YjgF/YER057c/UK114 family)
MGIVRRSYRVIVPKTAEGFEIQWEDCFGELTGLFKHSGYKPCRICVFIHVTDEKDYQIKSDLISASLTSLEQGSRWPVSIIPQSPEEPYQVIIEVGLIREDEGIIEYHSAAGLNYCTIKAEGKTELWMVGSRIDGSCENLGESAVASFQKMKEVLEDAGMGFDAIVRQWNYVDGILGSGLHNGIQKQHYQIFNEVRNTFYTQYRKASSFPAATGIGMNSSKVGIDCYAISSRDDMEIIPVSNPNQQESYRYGQEVLVGDPVNHKQPPQFERAVLQKSGSDSVLFISGTASIIGQETIGIGDVGLQTRITIENIEALSSQANLNSHCLTPGEYPDKFSYLRVYVKNRSDISVVKQLCLKHFGNIPATFVQADICRNNLLVEIEAEKVNG